METHRNNLNWTEIAQDKVAMGKDSPVIQRNRLLNIRGKELGD
jgi:hypothetical protein